MGWRITEAQIRREVSDLAQAVDNADIGGPDDVDERARQCLLRDER